MSEERKCKGCGGVVNTEYYCCSDCLEHHPALQPVRDLINRRFEREKNRCLKSLGSMVKFTK